MLYLVLLFFSFDPMASARFQLLFFNLDSWKDITEASMTILDPANGEPLLKAEASHIRFLGAASGWGSAHGFLLIDM